MGLFDEETIKIQTNESSSAGVLTVTIASSARTASFQGIVDEGQFTVGDDVVVEHANGKMTSKTIRRITDSAGNKFDIAYAGDLATFGFSEPFFSKVNIGDIVRKIKSDKDQDSNQTETTEMLKDEHIESDSQNLLTQKDNTNAEYMKCVSCGATVYFDMELGGFLCEHCGNMIPWDSPVHFNPRPLSIKYIYTDDSIPAIGDKISIDSGFGIIMNDLPDTSKWRTINLDSIIADNDIEAFSQWKDAEGLAFSCRNCGSEISGYSTQTIFECEFCGNKATSKDVISSGSYTKELIVGMNNSRKTPRAIPFRVSEENAKKAIIDLVNAYPNCFANNDIIRPLKDLTKVYVPVYLTEVVFVAKAQTEKGEIRFYQTRQNVTVPATIFFDAYLLNGLQPWDFGKIAPLRPAFLEGNVKIFSRADIKEDYNKIYADDEDYAPGINFHNLGYRLPLFDLAPRLKETFDVTDVKIEWIQYNSYRAKKTMTLLPMYFLDKMPHTMNASKTEVGDVRFAVNGQTGKVASLHNSSMPNEFILEKNSSRPPNISEVSTKYSPILPVINNNKKEKVFTVIDNQEVFAPKKKGLFW